MLPNSLSRWFTRLLAARKRHRDREELMTRAVDAVVAGTDPRIRAIASYRKKLRPAISASIRYVQDIVDRVPGPVVLAPSRYGSDPTVHACFSSLDDLRDLLARNKELHQLFDQPDHAGRRRAYAFLAMRRDEKNVFAPAMVDGRIERDVAQTLVSFADRRVIEAAPSGYLARRQLMRRAFHDLIASALNHLATLQDRRDSASQQRLVRQTRLQALQQKRAGFEDLIAGSEDDEREIARLEQQLAADHSAPAVQPLQSLEDYLDQVVEVFANPAKHLPCVQTSLHLTRMNRKLEPGQADDLNRIDLADARNSRGEQVSVIAVSIPRDELPAPQRGLRL